MYFVILQLCTGYNNIWVSVTLRYVYLPENIQIFAVRLFGCKNISVLNIRGRESSALLQFHWYGEELLSL